MDVPNHWGQHQILDLNFNRISNLITKPITIQIPKLIFQKISQLNCGGILVGKI